jgi:hypothetical protein
MNYAHGPQHQQKFLNHNPQRTCEKSQVDKSHNNTMHSIQFDTQGKQYLKFLYTKWILHFQLQKLDHNLKTR